MKRLLKLNLFLIGFIAILSISSKVNAATATISASTKSVVVGKSVTITANINAAAWNLNVSGETSASIVGANMEGTNQTTKKTYKITPTKAGEYTVYLKGDITDANDKKTQINTSVTITAKEESKTSNTTTTNTTDSSSNTTTNNNSSTTTNTKSTNANLSTLGVTPKKYDFSGFSSTKTSYSVTIPSDVDSLKVAYKTADSKATVKVTGNTSLEVGTNTIKVVVTAEDGKTTKTYTVKVTKLATEEEKPGNVIDEETDVDLSLASLSIEGLELSPEFSSDIYSYETTIDMDNNDMSEVNVVATASDENAVVEIAGNTDLIEGENLINIIVKADDSTEQTVYQITVNKVSEASEIVSSSNIIDNIKNIKKEYFIIGGFVLIVLIILAIIIIKAIRDKRYYEENDEEEEDFYNNNLNINENEETNNNLVEVLFKKRNNGEELKEEEKETIEDIEKENDRIFNKPKKGETVEYDIQDNDEIIKEENKDIDEDYIEKRINKRKKGKHF